jgi:hypothetical protein
MKKYTILDIPIKDGLPDIADADVSAQDKGKFVVHSVTFVRGINTKWMRSTGQVLALLRENKPGQYFVVAEQSFIDKLDPDNIGKSTAELGKDCLHYRVTGETLIEGELVDLIDIPIKFEEGTVPATLPSKIIPWVINGMTITLAERNVPDTDMAAVIEGV